MTSVAVEVSGLVKVFDDPMRGEVRAVDDVSFAAAPGEVLGLLGANGAGKTTTLRILATVLKPTAGRVVVAGHEVTVEPVAVRRALGFYSASTALYPRLTPTETLTFFARINGLSPARAAERARALIDRFEMGEYAHTRVDKLSSGMKQKVSIARAMAHDPPLLVFDEPTVGLDVMAALATVEAIGALRDEGKTVLYSTHIMSEVEKLCDRVAILHRGRVLACDTLARLRERTGERYLEDVFVHLLRAAGP